MGTMHDLPLSIPSRETIDLIRRILYHVAPQLAPPPAALDKLSQIMNEPALGLVNPPDVPLTPGSFDRAHAATQLEVGEPRRLQMVSFHHVYSDQARIDALLGESTSWGDRELAVGGLIHYRDGEPITAAVLLRREGNTLKFRLRGDLQKEGEWSLLQLPERAAQPYTFFTSRWTGFSHFRLQAALHYALPPGERTVARAQSAASTLVERGLLPADVDIRVGRARAAILPSGPEQEEQQEGAAAPQQADLPEQGPAFAPNAVIAPAAQCQEIEIAHSEVIVGVAAVTVLHNIYGKAWDDEGRPVALLAGDYRLDVMDLDDGPFGQMYDKPDHHVNVPLTLVDPVGEVIEGDPEDGDVPEIVIGSCYISYCSLTGRGAACKNNRKKKRVRIW